MKIRGNKPKDNQKIKKLVIKKDLLGSKNPSLGSARSQGLQYWESLSLGMKAK